MVFDLFELHSERDSPKGWIWVYFDCALLRKHYLKLLKSNPQNIIAKEISKALDCGFSTVGKHLIKLKNPCEKTWLPLPVIIELVKLIDTRLKYEIINRFECFICKSNKGKQTTKAIKEINEDLSKIIGAHMADGCLQRNKRGNNYQIKISDGRKDLIVRCAEWINKTFSVNPIPIFNKKDNTWNCYFSHKVIARYFENIFMINAGKKFDIAKEPEIIKNSDFKIRKAFAKGVLMFDGGVKATGMVSLTSMSKQLIEDIEEILKLDEIEVNKGYNPKKKSWLLESKSGRNKEYLKKWLYYFEEKTWKYDRLNFFIEKKKYNIKELEQLFPYHHRSKIRLKEVYDAILKIKKFKIQDVMEELNKFNISHITIYKYLYILEKSGLIYKEIEEHIGPKNGWQESIYSLV